MIYGYIRVSTDKQSVANQQYEIETFCNEQHLKVDGWIEETVSGTKNYDKRALGELLQRTGKGDLIICSELSRLGRSLFMIMEILSVCLSKDCRVWTIKDGYRLGDDIQSKVLAFAFGLSAEIERDLISQRTREALARKRAEGKLLGRPKGRRNNGHKLDGCKREIFSLRKNGMTCSAIANTVGVDLKTVKRYVQIMEESDTDAATDGPRKKTYRN